ALYLDFLQHMTALPDVVLYFEVNTETALKRRVRRGGTMDVIEMKGVEYQELVRSSFQKHIQESSGIRIFVIDANDTVEGVRSQVDAVINALTGEQTLDASNG